MHGSNLNGGHSTRGGLGLIAIAVLLLLAACQSDRDGTEHSDEAHEGETPHWTYSGEAGPEAWAELSSEFAACSTGGEQSPIDLAARGEPGDGDVAIHWTGVALTATNNGHTLHVATAPGAYIEIDGERFELVQFHFHAPSEHTIEGQPRAMETHFVHANEAGELAVIGVLHEVGAENEVLAPVFDALDADEGVESELEVFDPSEMLPADRSMYRYDGSLTTPPCTEGVRWHVLQETTTVSEAQVEAYRAIFPESARPTQPLGAREIEVLDQAR